MERSPINYLFILLAACMFGCATHYPMGLNRDQWEALSPTQQADYRARQYEIDQQRRMQQAAAQAERERLYQEQLQAERERVADLYANARFGDIVRVSIQGGALEFYGKRHPYHPVAFELARGEAKVIQVTRSGQVQQSVPFNVRLSQDGHTLFVNDDHHSRATLVKRDWERGQNYVLSTDATPGSFSLPGAIVFIKYVELPGAPQRVIIENR